MWLSSYFSLFSRFLCGIISLLDFSHSQAYQQSELRKIAAATDTPIKMFIGYGTRTGQYKKQCIKQIAERTKEQSPDAQSVFKMISSMEEMTRDRGMDIAASI